MRFYVIIKIYKTIFDQGNLGLSLRDKVVKQELRGIYFLIMECL
jgi:hypothetical protein